MVGKTVCEALTETFFFFRGTRKAKKNENCKTLAAY